jgi:hypothetical protein
MTLTEAAACGTPTVATDIAGHADAVAAGRSGLLRTTDDDLVGRSCRSDRRRPAERGCRGSAREGAAELTWERTALTNFEVLARRDAGARDAVDEPVSDEFVLGVDLDGVCADYTTGSVRSPRSSGGSPRTSLTTEVSWDFVEWGLDRESFLRCTARACRSTGCSVTCRP